MHTPIKAGVCTYVDMHQLSNPDQKQISGDGKVCQIQNIEIISQNINEITEKKLKT